MDSIGNNQLVDQPEEIGSLNGNKVMELTTKGGLYLVVVAKSNGKVETLGTGSHRAIARHIAAKDNPALKIAKLEKSESLPVQVLEANLPEFIELTKRFQELEQ